MKKGIIIIVTLMVIGLGVYFWVIPNFFRPSYPELLKLPSSTIAISPETPPTIGTNTQTFIEKALDAVPENNLANIGKTASAILKSMDYQAAQNLLPQIDSYNRAFAELRPAIEAEFNISQPDFRPERPVSNFIRAQVMGKLLTVKGMGLEKQGDLNEAVDAYLLDVQAGSVFAGKNTPLIQKLIAIALEKIAYKPLKQYVLNHPNDTENLKRIIATLEKAEQKRFPISEGFLSEKRIFQYVIQNYKQYNKTSKEKIKLSAADVSLYMEASDKLYGYMISSFEKPYPEFMKEDPYKKLIEMTKAKQVPLLLAMAVPNCTAAYVRDLATATDNRLVRVMAALALYHQEKQIYPSSLSELAPAYLATVPNDYFSDSAFIYGTRDDSYYLYSVGPDIKDNHEQLVYDPTNGTTSDGDIIGK